MKKSIYAKIPVMATHRSLNKMEFKAHMSIHNFVDVPEGERHESSAFTRDRLGKKHLLADESGQPRLGKLRKKTAIFTALFLLAPMGALWAGEDREAQFVRKKGPNIQVTSSDPEVHSVDNWMNRNDPKPEIFNNGSQAVGFNEDGDPNVSTRF